MFKPTLFICQSCEHAEHAKDQPADGALLLAQLNGLSTEQPNDIEIQPVSCLWTCDRPCAVAFSAPAKPTYLFTNLPANDAAAALLEFGKCYQERKTGNVPWNQLPELLQSVSVAKIPAVGRGK